MFREASKTKPEDFGDLFEPSEAAEPILAVPVRGALHEWLTEIWAADELEKVGIKPRRRAIFDGPPGVGKTTLAHHLAARLGLRMLAVRPDKLLSKWVHQTAEQIGQLFDALTVAAKRGEPIVLLLDEFDAIARQRRAAQQAADDGRNEDVNTLLQRIEQHDGFIIAATNYGASIDQAIWRRFDIHIDIELPGQPERERILKRYLAPYGLPPPELTQLAEALGTASPALMRALCENIKRQLVLGPILQLPMARDAVVGRVLAACHPHPEAGKPRLWSLGVDDHAVRSMPWPLPLAADIPAEPPPPATAESTGEVIQFGVRP